MKIAVCISGIAKNSKICYDSVKKYLIEPYNCDVFCSFWSRTEQECQELFEIYRANLCEFEKFTDQYKEIFDKWDWPYIMLEPHKKPTNAISMYYKIMRTNALRRSWEEKLGFKYDLIIRLRPDLELKSRVVLPEKVLDKRLYIPPISNNACFGVNDQMYACSPNTYEIIANNMYGGAYKLMAKALPIHPELFLAMFCFTNGIGIEVFEVSYSLLNEGGPSNNHLWL